MILRVSDEQLAMQINKGGDNQGCTRGNHSAGAGGGVIIYRTYGTFAAVLKGLRVAQGSLAPGLEHNMGEIVTTILVSPTQE